MRIPTYVGFLALATSLQAARAADLPTAEEYLSQNPNITAGRDALEEASRNLDTRTRDSFTILSRPAEHLVLLEETDSDTFEPLFTVALVDDASAEESYNQLLEIYLDEEKASANNGAKERRDECQPEAALGPNQGQCNLTCNGSKVCPHESQCSKCQAFRTSNCSVLRRCIKPT